MKSCILGAGVSGSLFSYLSGFPVYDKAGFVGGRTSHSISTGSKYDFGATILHKSILLKIGEQTYRFELEKFIQAFTPDCKLLPIRGMNDKFYLEQGANHLCIELTKNQKLFLEYKVQKLEKQNNSWKIFFENQESILVDFCIITFPIPQILNVLPETLKETWENFLQNTKEYRPCLTLTGFWDKTFNLNQAFKTLPYITYLIEDKDVEYFSIESEKYEGISHVILVQFSKEFSEKYFDYWMQSNKVPGSIVYSLKDQIFSKVFSKLNIPYQSPKEIRVHRWRYSTPTKTIFGHETGILLNENWSEYQKICKTHNLWIVSDLLFGKSVLHSLLGSLLVWESFSNQSEWKDSFLTPIS